MSKLSSSYIGWDTKIHLLEYDFWNNRCNLDFNFTYECFSEQKYLLESAQRLENPEIVDIGCATGTTYRFLHNKLGTSRYSYRGIDLSKPVIERARSLYPDVDFIISNGERPYKILGSKADIVFSRDTILHQENPYDFLDQLIEITRRFLIIRLRTRDFGETEFDVSKSCQMNYGSFWMPYIVLNIDELISYIKNKNNVVKVTMNKSYEVLGGMNHRFLPKDLYFEKTGSAETSIMIELDPAKQKDEVEIIYDKNIQGHEFLKRNRWNYKYLIYRLITKFSNRS
jgi:SAM-dependent methyltransferase